MWGARAVGADRVRGGAVAGNAEYRGFGADSGEADRRFVRDTVLMTPSS
ncbi:hypothetical protein STRIP9103_03903 [Streptomyces ipomoeae 91-03]|uniref:Uncharacterized protein n=1 Tax=Streptomyces ipomoeae 91-03 TaxID=698759 RepID=L1L866_9ACTN|nr:hypothetical protein STRIP9103_03903 [Streptomyces ipomoeae 91-03]